MESQHADIADNLEELSGREESVEHVDGLRDGGFNPSQTGNNTDAQPLITKLPERYERGEFHPHVHFTIPNGSFGFMSCCGVFMNERCLHEINLGGLLRSGADDGQFPMLIKAVHVMEDEQGVVRTVPLGDSIIWLQRLDECAGLITDSLYFSVEQGKFVGSRRPRSEDWKLDSVGVSGSASGLPQKLPDQIVKRGATVVQDFADEGGNSRRNLLLTPKLLELVNVLGISVNDFAVSFFIQEPINFDVKVLDVLIGPFESFLDPF
jgi:hypothetical protein